MYYRGANAALLLYDITNSSTFEDVRGWLEGNALSLCRKHSRVITAPTAHFGKSDLRN